MTDSERLHKIADELIATYEAKNHDYGDSVDQTFRRYGLVSFLVRIEDKINRLHALQTKQAKVQDEKVEDTLKDLANYALIAYMTYKKYKEAE